MYALTYLGQSMKRNRATKKASENCFNKWLKFEGGILQVQTGWEPQQKENWWKPILKIFCTDLEQSSQECWGKGGKPDKASFMAHVWKGSSSLCSKQEASSHHRSVSLSEQKPEATGEGQQTPFPQRQMRTHCWRKRIGNNNNILALGFPLYAQTISHLLTPWKGKVTKKAPTLRHREKGLSRIETEAGQQIISPCSLSPGKQEPRNRNSCLPRERKHVRQTLWQSHWENLKLRVKKQLWEKPPTTERST